MLSFNHLEQNHFTKLKHFLKYSWLKGESWQEVWMTKWTMVWRNNEMDYGLKENEWNYDKTEVMLIDDVMMELETNSRTEG